MIFLGNFCQKLALSLFLATSIFVFPIFVFTGEFPVQCSNVGYSIMTINGIFTDENNAKKNSIALASRLPISFNSEPLTVDYLHNESHVGGLGDLAMSAYQKFFEYETVEDYDLIEMLKSASEKVKTQKILLVAHSQGNFYANSFYDTVAGKTGGVQAESVGIYSVATPAARVAGGGKWLTSDTDNVIAGFVAKIPFKKIMPPNTSIEEFANSINPKAGHSFSDVYLKYRGEEIVSNIQDSLEKLKTNAVQGAGKNCIDPPKLTLAHKAEGVLLTVADTVFLGGKNKIVGGVSGLYKVGKTATLVVGQAVLTVGDLIKKPFIAESNKNDIAGNPAAAAIGVVVGKSVDLKSGIEYAPSANNFSANAVAALPYENSIRDVQGESTLVQNSLEKIRQEAETLREAKIMENRKEIAAVEIKSPNKQKIESEQKIEIETDKNKSRLVFLGPPYPGFGGGGAPPQASLVSALANTEVSTALSAPNIVVAQCDYSLASDGCLLATTTITFSWSAVSGAAYYAISKNGEYATTTGLSFAAGAADFSDYAFSISAVSAATSSLPAGQAGATSTKTVSVATIPIAINEIAWMGTAASSNDEWLELKNNTGRAINLSQWVIESEDSRPYIQLAGSIAPHEYLILERMNDSTILDVSAHAVYAGALNNTGDRLTLFYATTTMMDRTPDGAWTAGDNASSTARKTMERINSKESGDSSSNWATWGTNVNFIKSGSDAAGNAISGTPGQCNSASFININGGQSIYQNLTLEADNCYYVSSGVSVSATSTLTVEEGARISLYLNNLVVNGVLDVNGTSSNPVFFDSFSNESTTNKIRINNNNGTSTMDNVIISDTGGIRLNNSAALEITNAEFISNRAGIELNNNSVAVIENANFASTTREAITAYNGSAVSVASSTIANTIDADAIGIYNSTFSIASTTVSGVASGDGIGLYDSTSTVANVTVENVANNGIGVYGGSMVIASSAISDFGNDGIGVYSGADVSGEAIVNGVAVEY